MYMNVFWKKKSACSHTHSHTKKIDEEMLTYRMRHMPYMLHRYIRKYTYTRAHKTEEESYRSNNNMLECKFGCDDAAMFDEHKTCANANNNNNNNTHKLK